PILAVTRKEPRLKHLLGVFVLVGYSLLKDGVLTRSARAAAVLHFDETENELAALDRYMDQIAPLQADVRLVGRALVIREQINMGIHGDENACFQFPGVLQEQARERKAYDLASILRIVDQLEGQAAGDRL